MENGKTAIDFAEPRGGTFQKYSLRYSSRLPGKGKIFYNIPDGVACETFFLEPGENAVFSSYIDGFLSGASASGIYRLEFLPSKSGEAGFSLQELTTEPAGRSESVVYLENERFRLGADLGWGGGLCHVEDKRNPDGLQNLLNRCDAGRLIQQSYYGTVDSPYKCAVFNGSTWSYNPVQGGDQYANRSKLVDCSVSSNRLWVKCQPMDWAQNNRITPSYMENTYLLEEDCIRVDNRFVDFSGYRHRPAHQELPAFYVLSYLDRFTFYDGTRPWTGDALTVKDHLGFWGDKRESRHCYFTFQEGNTETWCAWTSGASGFGIGLYTPGAETLIAGRFAYNASKDPSDGATNYVAPLRTLCLESFLPLEYSYLITTGDAASICRTFERHRDFRDNASLQSFVKQDD